MSTFLGFQQLLTIKRYSTNTIESYIGLLINFQKFIGHEKPLQEIEPNLIIDIFKKFMLQSAYSQSSQKQLTSALKLYFSEMRGATLDFSSVATRTAQRSLPQILSLQEVKRILDALDNEKHRAMLTTIYALGLRSGELINLKVTSVDGDRNQISIQMAKGRKDRVLPFPEKLKTVLRSYLKKYKPTDYLFEGQRKDAYTPSSLRAVFNKACKEAGIKKNVTLHSLRHSYATHLMDAGTDVRIIKELLGHNSIKTTLIYTHVTQRSLDKVPSPLDFL